MVTSHANTAVTIRYDLVEEMVELLRNYRNKREEIESFLSSVATPDKSDPFAESDPGVYRINGIFVSQEAARVGLQAELSSMELKLLNRFNIVIGRPLPVAQAAPAEEGAEEAVEGPTTLPSRDA